MNDDRARVERQRSDPNDEPPVDASRRRLLQTGLAGAVGLAAGTLAACGGGGDGGGVPLAKPEVADAGAVPTADAGEAPRTTLLASRPPAYSVSGREILKDGKRFIAKGMNYSPTPIGGSFDFEPSGDFFGDFWQQLFNRDIGRLKAMGVNSLRLYSMLPFRFIDNVNSTRISHRLFLDACQAAGISVWTGFPIGGDVYEQNNPEQLERTRRGVELLAQDLANHPAVMGFVVGNEHNLAGRRAGVTSGPLIRDDPAFWRWVDEIAGIYKAAAPNKLTTTALFDDGMISIRKAEEVGMQHLDVFGINAYRGTVDFGFGPMFEEYEAVSKRPLLLTEFGCPASRRVGGQTVELPDRAAAQARYLATQWTDMVLPANQRIVSGGYVFTWSDEWWKVGTPAEHSSIDLGVNYNFPGNYDDQEWFGIHSVAPDPRRANQPDRPVSASGTYYPDILTPRAAVDTLTQLWNP